MNGKLASIPAVLVMFCLSTGCTAAVGSQPAAPAQPLTMINSPASNSEYHAGDRVAIQSTSTSANGIARVELSVDGTVIRSDTPPPSQVSFSVIQTWAAVEGQHTIAVRAFNPNNQPGNAAVIMIAVWAQTVTTPTKAVAPSPTNSPPATSIPAPAPTAASTPRSVVACDSATFVADITVPDGTVLAIGQGFNKIWRLRNVGACAWANGYTFAFVKRTCMSASSVIAVPFTPAGATADLLVPMIAPSTTGVFTSDWRLRNTAGIFFGPVVFANIKVIALPAPLPAPAPTPFPVPLPAPLPTGCVGTPVIASFVASPLAITAGQSATLTWGLVGNADRADIDQGIGGVATPGSMTVTPSTTTRYTLTASCGSSTTTAQVIVVVVK